MSTGLIVALVVVAIVVIALVALWPKLNRKREERQLERRRGEVADHHRSEAEQRLSRAEMAEKAARRERAEAELHQQRAEAANDGLVDEELEGDEVAAGDGRRTHETSRR